MSDVNHSRDQDHFTRLALMRQQRAPSPLVNAAKMLGLNPAPTGAREDEWQAACPHTSHQLSLDIDADCWTCSCCSFSGDVEALELLWRRRRSQAA